MRSGMKSKQEIFFSGDGDSIRITFAPYFSILGLDANDFNFQNESRPQNDHCVCVYGVWSLYIYKYGNN